MRVDAFPAVFLYDNGAFYQYHGILDYESIKYYIEKMYYFKCSQIVSEDLVKLKSNYVLGVLNNDEVETINLFNEFNYGYKNIVENCYYIISSARDLIDESSYIMAYNGNKVTFFTELALLLKYQKDSNYQTLKDAAKIKYRNFIMNHLYPHYEEFETRRYYNYLARKFNFLVFSYITEEERVLFTSLIEQMRFFKVVSNVNYHILLVYSPQLNSSKNWKYFKNFLFSEKSGIYLTNLSFENIKNINQPELYTVSNIIYILDAIRPGSNSTTSQEKRFRSPIIVEKLDRDEPKPAESFRETLKENKEGSESKESQVVHSRNFVVIIYLATYTFIFYVVYRKYFAIPENLIKES
jgi:hypothetical protein